MDSIFNKYPSNSKPFFSLNDKVTGENHLLKLKKINLFLKKIN